jgi:hypothetical protein
MKRVGLALLACLSCDASREAPTQVLFVCEHGAAKSAIAAAYFNELAGTQRVRARAIARGVDPQDAPSTPTVAGLREDRMPIGPAGEVPRPVTEADLAAAKELVVFDCGEPPMRALAARGVCWDDVPAVGAGYGRARDVIREHLDALVNRLSKRGP